MIRYGQQSKFAKQVLSDLEPLQPKIKVTELVTADDTDDPNDRDPAKLDDDETETD